MKTHAKALDKLDIVPIKVVSFLHTFSSSTHNKTRDSNRSFKTKNPKVFFCCIEQAQASIAMAMNYKNDLNLKATELRLGLPGSDEPERQTTPSPRNNKRSLSEIIEDSKDDHQETAPPAKAQVVGWPPIRSYRKNCLQGKKDEAGMYVKVSVDGAAYLRKIDIKVYKSYPELLKVLENMFKLTIGYNGSEYAPTYEDKDGDWMLVGDVPWEMFMSSCKRLRIMKGSEARGLGCV